MSLGKTLKAIHHTFMCTNNQLKIIVVGEIDGFGDEEIDWEGEEGWGSYGSVGWNVEVEFDVDVVAAIVVDPEKAWDQRVVGVGFAGKGIFDTRVEVQRWLEIL